MVGADDQMAWCNRMGAMAGKGIHVRQEDPIIGAIVGTEQPWKSMAKHKAHAALL